NARTGAQILAAGVHTNREASRAFRRHLPHEAPIAGAKIEQNVLIAGEVSKQRGRVDPQRALALYAFHLLLPMRICRSVAEQRLGGRGTRTGAPKRARGRRASGAIEIIGGWR